MNCFISKTAGTSNNFGSKRRSADSGDEGPSGKKPKAIQESDLCPICLGELNEDDSYRSPCLHKFHVECFLLSTGYDDRCPVCRHQLGARRRGTGRGAAPWRTPTSPVGSRQATRTLANQRSTNRNQTTSATTSWAAREPTSTAPSPRRTAAYTVATTRTSRRAYGRFSPTAWNPGRNRGRYAGPAKRTQMPAIATRQTYGSGSSTLGTTSTPASNRSNATTRNERTLGRANTGPANRNQTTARTQISAHTASPRNTVSLYASPTVANITCSGPGRIQTTASANPTSIPQTSQTISSITGITQMSAFNSNPTTTCVTTTPRPANANRTGPLIIEGPGLRMIINQRDNLTAPTVNSLGNEQHREFHVEVPTCSIS